MDAHTFALLHSQHKEVLQRLDRLGDKFDTHAAEDAEVHKMVERHNLYFNIAFLGVPALVALIGRKVGLLGDGAHV